MMNNFGLFDLTGKKAVVTGAGGGLGGAMAEGLMEAGAEVVLLDITEKIIDLAAGFNAKGYHCHAVVADLSKKQEVENAFVRSIAALGDAPDILINAAGIQRRYKCEEFPYEQWQEVLNINLNAVFILCQLAGREMIKKGKGKIINIASMLSFFGGYTVPAYAASKGGIVQLTKALANEWSSKGINVNAIAPGYMYTAMNKELINDPVRYNEILKRIPAGRWGTPDDMKGTAIFLSSTASDYLCGAVIPVDGGYLSR